MKRLSVVLIVLIIITVGLVVAGCNESNQKEKKPVVKSGPYVSFTADANAPIPSIEGTYKISDPDLVRILDVKSDGTYLDTAPPTAYRGEETFPGVWSDVVGGKGVWRDPMNEGVSYKLVGRFITRSTNPEDIRRQNEYWYITEDGDITTQLNLYLKQ